MYLQNVENDSFTAPSCMSEINTRNKILLQKVYTTWLQFTLDRFIKKKVLKRFQSYREQKLIEKIFRILKGDTVGV